MTEIIDGKGLAKKIRENLKNIYYQKIQPWKNY